MSNRVNLLIPALVSASTAAPVLTPMRGAKNQNVVLDPDELNLAAVRRSIKCVLLSDDHQFCVLVRSYLQHLGFCVFTCSSSDRAEQQFLDRRDIDLWVVDIEALGVDAMCLAPGCAIFMRNFPSWSSRASARRAPLHLRFPGMSGSESENRSSSLTCSQSFNGPLQSSR